MQTFKRTPINVVKNAIYNVFGIGVFAIIIYYLQTFLTSWDEDLIFKITAGLTTIVGVYLIYELIIGEAISVTITPTELQYCVNKKIKHTYTLEDHFFSYRMKSDSSSTDTINLTVSNINNEVITTLNCEPLGRTQFLKMYQLIEDNTVSENPIILGEELC